MNDIAVFMEASRVSYSAIFVTMGALAALICSCIMAFVYKQKLLSVMATGVISLITATLCSRLLYWYCCPEQFDSFFAALKGFSNGGYSLAGAMVGVLIAAVIVRIIGYTDDLVTLLDCLAPGAAIGIAIGRLGGFFSNDDKGNYIFADSKFHGLPLSVPVQDSVTNSVEWRFASFFWEFLAGAAIFVALIVLISLQPSNQNERSRRGDIFMAFLSMFGATQATLESTRYDALHMRSNGFVSMTQLIALIMLLIPLVYYIVRVARAKKAVKQILICSGVSLAALGGAGGLEYLVQRKARYAMAIHPGMMALMLTASAMTLLLAICLYKKDEKAAANEAYAEIGYDEDAYYSNSFDSYMPDEDDSDLMKDIDDEFGSL